MLFVKKKKVITSAIIFEVRATIADLEASVIAITRLNGFVVIIIFVVDLDDAIRVFSVATTSGGAT